MIEYEIRVGSEPWQRAAALCVRYQVFVVERGIDRADEFDDQDIDGRIYANLLVNQLPVSTGRLLQEDEEVARLTRIATLSAYRGHGFGRQIVQKLENYAKETGYKQLIIHSELTAKSFYEELGYEAVSAIYLEDGQECQSLAKEIGKEG